MQTVGVYLIFAATVLRAAVVLADAPEFSIVMVLLAGYGLLLFGKTWLMRHKLLGYLQIPAAQIAYLFLQSILAIGILIASSYEDFLAMLFIPPSLDAMTFFGRRYGWISIAIFSVAMMSTLLFSDVGPLFGLVMAVLYSGLCFLLGGYSYQVEKAQAARSQNERTFHELQVAYRQLKGYADQRINLAIEQERDRLARDLHDSVTQTVFSMNLAAQSAGLLWKKEPTRTPGQLLRLEELAASAQQEIQMLVSHLSPRSAHDQSLSIALQRLAAEQKAKYGLQVSLEIRGERQLSATVLNGLYSIAHEALTNVVKHSAICEAILRLHLDQENSCLEIEDHGLGFHPELGSEQRGHLGLASMFERANEIGWHLSIVSRPGQGTRIVVTENPSGVSE